MRRSSRNAIVGRPPDTQLSADLCLSTGILAVDIRHKLICVEEHPYCFACEFGRSQIAQPRPLKRRNQPRDFGNRRSGKDRSQPPEK